MYCRTGGNELKFQNQEEVPGKGTNVGEGSIEAKWRPVELAGACGVE